jgi:preprotein translocase subunit SecB
MKAQTSPLRLHEIELLESNFKFIIPEEDEIENVQALFDSYKIDIDFAHEFDEDGYIFLLCKIGVNNARKKESGYQLFAQASGVYSIEDNADISPNLIQNLRLYSTLNMMINYLRNVFQQQTCQAPMSTYLLPPIDVLKLFLEKKKQASKK